MELGRVSKKYHIPYRVPIRQAKWSVALMKLGSASKKVYNPYRLPILQAKWSYAVMELGRVSKKVLYPIPSTYSTDQMELCRLRVRACIKTIIIFRTVYLTDRLNRVIPSWS